MTIAPLSQNKNIIPDCFHFHAFRSVGHTWTLVFTQMPQIRCVQLVLS